MIGAPLYWPYYAYGYPGYGYYDPGYPYYDPGYAYYDNPAQAYVEPGTAAPAQPQTQFYCPDTGYYPTVPTCPQGWLRVVPDNAAPPH